MRHQATQPTPPNGRPTYRAAPEVQDLLSRVARAVTAGDGKQMALLWEVPSIVISAETIVPITSREQLEVFFGSAKTQYNERGITDTRADILHEDWIGDHLVVVKVRWPYLDARGREIGGEASDYTLRRNPMGQLHICSILMRGVEN